MICINTHNNSNKMIKKTECLNKIIYTIKIELKANIKIKKK